MQGVLRQILNRSCSQICCTVTGGAYQSVRRVSLCVRNSYKSGSCLNFTRRMHQPRPSTLFFHIFSLAREKIWPPEARRKRPRRNKPPRHARSLLSSESVSSFPNRKRFAGLRFGVGLDGTRLRCSRSLVSSEPVSSSFPPNRFAGFAGNLWCRQNKPLVMQFHAHDKGRFGCVVTGCTRRYSRRCA